MLFSYRVNKRVKNNIGHRRGKADRWQSQALPAEQSWNSCRLGKMAEVLGNDCARVARRVFLPLVFIGMK